MRQAFFKKIVLKIYLNENIEYLEWVYKIMKHVLPEHVLPDSSEIQYVGHNPKVDWEHMGNVLVCGCIMCLV